MGKRYNFRFIIYGVAAVIVVSLLIGQPVTGNRISDVIVGAFIGFLVEILTRKYRKPKE